MKTKHFFQMMMSVLVASMLAMTSCSKDTDLLDTVPVTSSQVAAIDLYKLFTEMGCTEEDGKLILSSDLETILSKIGHDVSEEFKLLLSTNAIDMHQVVAFAENGRPVVTFMVNDVEVLVDALRAEKIDSAQGFDFYNIGGGMLALKENQCWMYDGSPEMIARIYKEAEAKSIASMSHVYDALRDDNILNAYFKATYTRDYAIEGATEVCALLNADFEENGKKLSVDIVYCDTNGDNITVDNVLEDINIDVEHFVSPNDNYSMAIGIKNDADWDLLTNMSQLLPFKARTAMSVAIPYLKRIDGTVFASVKLSENIEDSDFVAVIEMDEPNCKKSLQDLYDIVSTIGIRPIEEASGNYMIPIPGMDKPLQMGVYDSRYLFLSNRRVEQNGNKTFKDVISGNKVGAYIYIDKETADLLHFNIPWGFEISMSADDAIKLEGRLIGVDTPIMVEIVRVMALMASR